MKKIYFSIFFVLLLFSSFDLIKAATIPDIQLKTPETSYDSILDSYHKETYYIQSQDDDVESQPPAGNFIYNDNGQLKVAPLNLNDNRFLFTIYDNQGKYYLKNNENNLLLNHSLSYDAFSLNNNKIVWTLEDLNNGFSSYRIKYDLNYLNNKSNNIVLSNWTDVRAFNFNLIKKDVTLNIIQGNSVVTKEQMKKLIENKVGAAYFNSTAPIYSGSNMTVNQYYNKVIDTYYQSAPGLGIRPDIAVSQMLHETGYLKFGGLVKIDQFNFAGISATGSPITEQTSNLRGADPNKVKLVVGENAARFSSIETGVQGHLEHLLAYATNTQAVDSNGDGVLEINGKTMADPRFTLVAASNRGTAVIIEALNGKWAVPGLVYGQMILKILNEANSININNNVLIPYELQSGIYSIKSMYSTKKLDVWGGSTNNNFNIIQNDYNGNNNQIWNIEKLYEFMGWGRPRSGSYSYRAGCKGY